MKNLTDNIGPLEKVILDLIWTKKCSTVKMVHKELSDHKKIAYTTVMTIMNRLVEKNILSRKKEGKFYTYCPTTSRKQFLRDLVKKTLSYFATNYGEDAIVAFFHEADKLSDKDRKEIIHILNPRHSKTFNQSNMKHPNEK